IRMNFAAANQLDPIQVARAQFKIAVAFRVHQERRTVDLQRIERFAERLRLRFLHIERIHDDQLAIGKLRRQRRTQRPQDFLAGKRVLIRVWLRSMNGTAMAPQRRANRTDAGASGALLLPELLAGSGYQLLVLGRMRAGALGGSVMLHRLPEKVFIDGAEDFIGKIKRADLGSAQIVNINGCHMLLSLPGTTLSWLRAWLPSTDRP